MKKLLTGYTLNWNGEEIILDTTKRIDKVIWLEANEHDALIDIIERKAKELQREAEILLEGLSRGVPRRADFHNTPEVDMAVARSLADTIGKLLWLRKEL